MYVMYIFLPLISLMVASFLNVVIYRLPLMMQFRLKYLSQSHRNTPVSSSNDDIYLQYTKPPNLYSPRSFCPHCKHMISWWQNIPLFSYLHLKTRCFYCNEKISPQYFLVELIVLLLSIATLSYTGITWRGCCMLLFIWFAVPLFVIDLKHQLLPDIITKKLLITGLLLNYLNVFVPFYQSVIGALAGYWGLKLVIGMYEIIIEKEVMGQGDIKLYAAIGAWVGMIWLLPLLFYASLIGMLVSLVYLIASGKGRNTRIPFGPFLLIAGFAVLFIVR